MLCTGFTHQQQPNRKTFRQTSVTAETASFQAVKSIRIFKQPDQVNYVNVSDDVRRFSESVTCRFH